MKGRGGGRAANPVRGGVGVEALTHGTCASEGIDVRWNAWAWAADQFLFEMRSRIEVAERERCGSCRASPWKRCRKLLHSTTTIAVRALLRMHTQGNEPWCSAMALPRQVVAKVNAPDPAMQYPGPCTIKPRHPFLRIGNYAGALLFGRLVERAERWCWSLRCICGLTEWLGWPISRKRRLSPASRGKRSEDATPMLMGSGIWSCREIEKWSDTPGTMTSHAAEMMQRRVIGAHTPSSPDEHCLGETGE
ncbi:hypothetical protein FB567DRAFT_277037 [Paraphoma chrysanthemicola]|uniref:Uncharacterized protein n=1 Tax=Paraphoma chrysanthemicola TaxID=798071 RepID=A0A8K0RBV0_9PLEO|nr:hypothetical protein FB567DRAFT_277037 [Paraphoma chrysanthemicola]